MYAPDRPTKNILKMPHWIKINAQLRLKETLFTVAANLGSIFQFKSLILGVSTRDATAPWLWCTCLVLI